MEEKKELNEKELEQVSGGASPASVRKAIVTGAVLADVQPANIVGLPTTHPSLVFVKSTLNNTQMIADQVLGEAEIR